MNLDIGTTDFDVDLKAGHNSLNKSSRLNTTTDESDAPTPTQKRVTSSKYFSSQTKRA